MPLLRQLLTPVRLLPGLTVLVAAWAAVAVADTLPPIVTPLSVAIFSPLDTSPAGRRVINHVQFNLIYGASFGLSGFALGLGVNDAEERMRGLQLAGFANLAGGEVHGTQIGTFYNRSAGTLDGLQLGIVNQAGELNAGMQWGVVNLAARATGFQFAIVDLADTFNGLQLATVNIADDVNGAQIGFVDLADEVNGTQIGFVNVADEVTGSQIGLVNIAAANKYSQIGFINIDSSNWFRIYQGVGKDGRAEIGIKSGSKLFFGDVGFSSHGKDAGKFSRKISFVGGLGLIFRFSVFSLSGQFNRQVTQQNDRPYTFPVTFTFPLGGPVEGFASGGPDFNRDFRYQQADWLLGCQVLLREQSFFHKKIAARPSPDPS